MEKHCQIYGPQACCLKLRQRAAPTSGTMSAHKLRVHRTASCHLQETQAAIKRHAAALCNKRNSSRTGSKTWFWVSFVLGRENSSLQSSAAYIIHSLLTEVSYLIVYQPKMLVILEYGHIKCDKNFLTGEFKTLQAHRVKIIHFKMYI